MKIAWAGSEHAFQVSHCISRLVAADPAFSKDNRGRFGRKELFKNALKKSSHAGKRINELGLNEEEATELRNFVDEPAYADTHWMFGELILRKLAFKLSELMQELPFYLFYHSRYMESPRAMHLLAAKYSIFQKVKALQLIVTTVPPSNSPRPLFSMAAARTLTYCRTEDHD